MSRILLVEDDALIAGIYGRKISEAGFEVGRAEDGLAAMKCLPEFQPDLVVLDLMMPKLSGADVLKFIRDDPVLKSTRVIVFSNAFLNKLGEQVAALGVEEMLLKSAVTPELLIESIRKILAGAADASPPRILRERKISPSGQTDPGLARKSGPAFRTEEYPVKYQNETPEEFRDRLRRDFFEQIPAICGSLRETCAEFMKAAPPAELRAIEALNRKVGFLTHMTSMAGCHRIAHLSSALEAFLFELGDRREDLTESSRNTVLSTVELLADFLVRTPQTDEQRLAPARILVVDDDPISSRGLSAALRRAKLTAKTLSDPLEAIRDLATSTYDVVILDINLPGVSGTALCDRMRAMPRHAHTPVIFVTAYPDMIERTKPILTGNDDIIQKPVLPMELTVKVIALDLKNRLT